MPKLTISEAAKLYGKSRSTLYKHNRDGVLSFSDGPDGKSTVDLSEMMRVYGPVPNETFLVHEEEHTETTEKQLISALSETIRQQEKMLSQAEEREAWLRKQLEESEQQRREAQRQILLLSSHQPNQKQQEVQQRRWWWPWK